MLTATPVHWLDALLQSLTATAASGSFFAYDYNLRMLLALAFVALCCGAVGSMVVGGRMAFFSDAIAHSAFAGVSLGFVAFTFALSAAATAAADFWSYATPVMVAYGVLVAAGIAYVRERTGLAGDTVIGVFFAFNVGLAAVIGRLNQDRRLFGMEEFLFGDPIRATAPDLVHLAGLVVLTWGVLALTFNHLLLTSCSPSLALSRGVRVRAVNYAFIILLAVLVNLCVRTVGVLLINALLIVPAAAANNLAADLRRMFWLTLALCVGSAVTGVFACWEFENRFRLKLGVPGTVILVSVLAFVISAPLGAILKRRRAAHV